MTRSDKTVEQGVASDARDTLSKTLHEGKSLNVREVYRALLSELLRRLHRC